MSALNRLLEIEETSGVWDARAGGMHLWPIVRFAVLRQKWNEAQGFEAEMQPRRLRVWPAALAQLPRTLGMLRRASGTLFLTHEMTRIKSAQGADSFDRLHDPFFDHVGQPLILETMLPGRPMPADRRWAAQVYLQDAMWAWVKLRAAARSISHLDRKSIDAFVEHVMRTFDLPPSWRGNRNVLASAVRTLPAMEALVKRRLAGKIVDIAFVSNACLMGPMHGIYVTALKRADLRVVEIQHGFIGPSHTAYNFPACAMHRDHPCRLYLPDMMLTFGDWWATQVRLPVKTHTVGCPALLLAAEQLGAKCKPDHSKILLVSQGLELASEMIATAKAVSSAQPHAEITFKLHPAESMRPQRYDEVARLLNAKVVGDVELYPLLAEHGTIIGSFSTVLFEALAFGDKRIFISANESVSAQLGATFESPQQLSRLLVDRDAGRTQLDSAQLWADDWQARFDAALAQLGASRRVESSTGGGT